MADRIGKLGQSVVAVQGSTPAYQCPAGKAAKCQLFFRGVAGASSSLQVFVAGVLVFATGGLAGGNVSFSTSAVEHNTGTAASINGSSDATTVAPGPKVYWLAAGDVISYTIGTADFASMMFQVVGIEVDVV